MKKMMRNLGCLVIVGLLISPIPTQAEEKKSSDKKEGAIELNRDFDFKDAKKEEKAKEYKKFDDKIHATAMKDEIKDLKHVKKISSEADYIKLINETNKEAKIVYLGFDECPFCQAFLPKLHAIAEDYDATIYYYDVNERNEDPSFSMIIENFYKVNEVPHAFIVKDSKVQGEPLNSESPMIDMEEFIKKSLEEK